MELTTLPIPSGWMGRGHRSPCPTTLNALGVLFAFSLLQSHTSHHTGVFYTSYFVVLLRHNKTFAFLWQYCKIPLKNVLPREFLYTLSIVCHGALGQCGCSLNIFVLRFANDISVIANSGRRPPRSASDRTRVDTHTRSTEQFFGDRIFCVVGSWTWNGLPLLQRAQCSHCKRCITYSNSVRLSVCLSVCPSHAGTVSKRRHVARCSLHRSIAKCV